MVVDAKSGFATPLKTHTGVANLLPLETLITTAVKLTLHSEENWEIQCKITRPLVYK